ncbi:MAG: hypothetical protein IJX72_01455 [Clostridia bacterium]|nr:hypothetical protein [Clostridia bacterium]
MSDWKRICHHLLFPPVWVMILLTLVSGGGLALVFIKGWDTHPIGYAVFVLSAYTMTVLVLFCVKVLPSRIRELQDWIHSIPLADRYMTDAAFKVKVSLMANLLYNTAFAAFYLGSGIANRSFWMGGIGIYYFLLSVLRFPLFKYIHSVDHRDYVKEYKQYRLTGIGLLLLNCSLSLVMGQMLLNDETYSYPGLMIFVVAAYTFGALTVAIVHVVRYRKYKSPVLSASRTVQFTAAIVSIMTLETAMLEQFSEGQVEFDDLMKTLTAIGVYLLVMVMSIYMIVRANRELKRLRQAEEQTKSHHSLQ